MSGIVVSKAGLSVVDLANIQSGGVYKVNTLSNAKANTFNGYNPANYNSFSGYKGYQPNQPISAPTPNNGTPLAPNSTPSNSASPVSSPATSASGLGAFFNSPIGKALGAIGAIAGLADAASNLGSSLADTLSNADGTGTRNKAARKSLSDSNARYDKALSDRQAANAANSKGNVTESGDPNYVLPFTGGQSLGVAYELFLSYEVLDAGILRSTVVRNGAFAIVAPLKGVTVIGEGSYLARAVVTHGGVPFEINLASSNAYFPSPMTIRGFSPSIERVDGQTDTGGDPLNPNPFTKYYAPPVDFYKNRESTDPNNPYSPNYFPYLPTISVAGNNELQPDLQPNPSNDNQQFKELEKPNFAPLPIPTPIPVPPTVNPFTNTNPTYSAPPNANPATTSGASSTSGTTSSGTSSSGMSGFTSTPATQTPATQTGATQVSATSTPTSQPTANGTGNPNADNLPVKTPVPTTPLNPSIPPSQNKNPLTNPLNPPKVALKPPTTNDPANLGNIATILGTIGLGITAITQRTNKIDGQTTPQAQQTNAKQGVCDAMQPQQCGFEGVKQATTEATNPIKDIANDNKGVLAAIVGNLAALAKLIVDNFTKLFTFLDINAKVEAVKSTITLALTLHNALMLSQNLGTTIGAIIDNVLATFGQTFKTTEGVTVSASEFLGASVKNWIINVIGVDNYLKLTETLAMANRIYQTGINVLSTVQGILDSAASVAQATGINVAKIGNALRDDGTINPKAYTHMDDTKAGNRPTTLGRFEQLTTTISDFDSKAQNLVTVTAAPIQVKEAVKQSKEDIKAFNDARDTNSAANKEAKLAKLEEIKALKAITEAVVSKKDDDT